MVMVMVMIMVILTVTKVMVTIAMAMLTITSNNRVNNFKPLSNIIGVKVVCQILEAYTLTFTLSILGFQFAGCLFKYFFVCVLSF